MKTLVLDIDQQRLNHFQHSINEVIANRSDHFEINTMDVMPLVADKSFGYMLETFETNRYDMFVLSHAARILYEQVLEDKGLTKTCNIKYLNPNVFDSTEHSVRSVLHLMLSEAG